MDRSQFLFALVDVLGDPLQNYHHYKGIARVKDIVYNTNFKNECKADFFYRKELLGKEKLPVIINIHGGGFVKGHKRHRRSLSGFYASLGYFVINICYRLAPKNTFPCGLIDVQMVVNRLPEWAELFDLDLTKVVLTGDSAGAYYAAQTAAAMTNEDLRQGLKLEPYALTAVAVMPFSGIYDIEQAIGKKLPLRITHVIGNNITGMKLDKDFKNLKEYPLLKYFSVTDFVTNRYPKTFISYAKHDMFAAGQGETFVKKLAEFDISYEEDCADKLIDNHCYHLMCFLKASKRCMAKVESFLLEIKNT